VTPGSNQERCSDVVRVVRSNSLVVASTTFVLVELADSGGDTRGVEVVALEVPVMRRASLGRGEDVLSR
jgi:hypothetical protein